MKYFLPEPQLEKKTVRIFCKDCYEQIKECSTPLLNIEKKTYPIGEYELVFKGYGASLRRVLEDGTIEYKNVKKDVDIDLERLEGGDYTLEELMEIGEKIWGNTKDILCLSKMESMVRMLNGGRIERVLRDCLLD